MKRQLPLALVFIFGTFMIFQNFVPHENSQWVYEFLLDWIMIIGIFALALGIWSLFEVSLDKVSEKKPNWGYSYVTMAGLFGMMIFGFTARTGEVSTQISCDFTDADQPAVSTLVVSFQLRESGGAVVNLITDGSHGDDNLTIEDKGDGQYTATYDYDPADTQLVGLYDLYFDVSDGTEKAVDDFANNADELALNDPSHDDVIPLVDSAETAGGEIVGDNDNVSAAEVAASTADTISVAPVIISGATKVGPNSIFRADAPWGFFIPFVVCFMGVIFSLQLAMMKRVTAKMRQLGGFGLLFFLAACILIAIFDNSWRAQFFYPEGEQAIGLQSTMFRAVFDHVMIPCLSTMFALLAFFISSAAYRAFRARNILASLLLFAALVVMLRFNPYLPFGSGEIISDTSNWLMNVPNLAAQRAMVIGIGLGIVATAMKVILGIERGYMGRG